jgi:hypothetical protein
MHEVEKGLNEVCGMLKIIESDIKKCAWYSHLMVVQNKPSFNKNGTSWQKKKAKAEEGSSSMVNPQPKKKARPIAYT